MQFVGQFEIDTDICDALIKMHKAADQQGLIQCGALGSKGASLIVDTDKKNSYD